MTLEDLDFNIEATNITIRGLMSYLGELEEKRAKAIRRYHNELHGHTYKKTYCLCSWKEGKQIINPKCPQHKHTL
jgi:hypothetical protein